MSGGKASKLLFACVLAFCFASANLSALAHTPTPPPKIPAHYFKQITIEGQQNPFTMELYLSKSRGKTYLEFVGTSPETSHTSTFKTELKPSNTDAYSFVFTDDWKTSGKGTVKFVGKTAQIHLEKTKNSPGGLNAAECWPDKETLTLER